MKKLFFSIIALVSFSAVSMANTVAIDKKCEVNEQKIKIIEPCMVTTFVFFNGAFVGSYTLYSTSWTCSGVVWRDLLITSQRSVVLE